MEENKTVRPTVRLSEEFNKKLKKAMIDNDTNFQKLSEELLQKWYKENKGE